MNIRLETDVLIIGGGMAAAWAAIAAAEAGARVIVADKGYMGTSGVTATGGPNHWWVAPDPALRDEAIARQQAKALGLADPEWMARILDLTWRHLPRLAPYYPFAPGPDGKTYFSGVRGPEYMRALRRLAQAFGVAVLDHHPALALLADADGRVAGAHGHALRRGQDWQIRAGATILATGGNAFRSGLIGSHTNTGDGHLMAAEAGARLEGLEFGPSWSLSPTWASTRTLPYTGAQLYDAKGRELDIPPPSAGHAHLQALGKVLQAGPVLADLVDAPAALPPILRRIQPFTSAAFERRGINLFAERFAVRLWGEGSIRGTGGIRTVDAGCQTDAPGLFAAGDAASRVPVAGAASGGGAVNAAWALGSGYAAGGAAARFAQKHPAGAGQSVARHGLHPTSAVRSLDTADLIAKAGAHVHGYTRSLWKTETSLADSAGALDALWQGLARHGHGTGAQAVAMREAAAVVAGARWQTALSQARHESRGLHVREDFPKAAAQAAAIAVSGVDELALHGAAYLEEAA